MSLSTPPEGKEFKAIEARGLQPAICSLIVDMGTLKSVYNGIEKNLYKVYFEFTLTNKEKVGQIFTFSFHEGAALTKALKSWCNSSEFTKDLSKYLGSMVVLNLIEDKKESKVYVNIDSFIYFDINGPFKESAKSFEGVNCYSFDYADPQTWLTFENKLIPQYIFDKMADSEEFKNWVNDKIKA